MTFSCDNSWACGCGAECCSVPGARLSVAVPLDVILPYASMSSVYVESSPQSPSSSMNVIILPLHVSRRNVPCGKQTSTILCEYTSPDTIVYQSYSIFGFSCIGCLVNRIIALFHSDRRDTGATHFLRLCIDFPPFQLYVTHIRLLGMDAKAILLQHPNDLSEGTQAVYTYLRKYCCVCIPWDVGILTYMHDQIVLILQVEIIMLCLLHHRNSRSQIALCMKRLWKRNPIRLLRYLCHA